LPTRGDDSQNQTQNQKYSDNGSGFVAGVKFRGAIEKSIRTRFDRQAVQITGNVFAEIFDRSVAPRRFFAQSG
jgi:hypothetical protein